MSFSSTLQERQFFASPTTFTLSMTQKDILCLFCLPIMNQDKVYAPHKVHHNCVEKLQYKCDLQSFRIAIPVVWREHKNMRRAFFFVLVICEIYSKNQKVIEYPNVQTNRILDKQNLLFVQYFTVVTYSKKFLRPKETLPKVITNKFAYYLCF